MSEFSIRPVTDDEYPAFVTAVVEGFSDDVPSEDFTNSVQHVLPPERTLAVFDGEAIVGTFGGYDLEVTVPGGAVPMEGTTVVTVFPTHRRLGLMREMMERHLENAVAHGYPIAGLWASDSSIYGQFGYGVATYAETAKFDGSKITFRDEVVLDRLRRITKEQATEILPPIFERICPEVPGMFARDALWWEAEVLKDEEWMKRGRTSHRIVIHDGPDGPDGYAIYRQKPDESDDGHFDGTVHVVEVQAATPRARASLWSYLTNVDGCPNVRVWNMASDDSVRMMVTEPRRMAVVSRFDALWVRILDVVAALSGRTYERDGSVVFGLVDEFRPETEGTYRLEVVGGVGSCERVDRSPEIELDVDVLGAIYLGAGGMFPYRDANRVRGDAVVVADMEQMFRTVRSPWCNQVF